jgi:hypothetical protein
MFHSHVCHFGPIVALSRSQPAAAPNGLADSTVTSIIALAVLRWATLGRRPCRPRDESADPAGLDKSVGPARRAAPLTTPDSSLP